MDASGSRLATSDIVRCKDLVTPPAWEAVWICQYPNGHIQAIGSTPPGASSTSTTPSGDASATRRNKRAVALAMSEVADHLGNTPAVVRSAYVDPRVVDLFEDGITIER